MYSVVALFKKAVNLMFTAEVYSRSLNSKNYTTSNNLEEMSLYYTSAREVSPGQTFPQLPMEKVHQTLHVVLTAVVLTPGPYM